MGRERVAAADDPGAALAALVDWHVDFALRHRPLIVVQDRDWESLPAEARERVRTPAARVRRPLGRPAARGARRGLPDLSRRRPGDGARGLRPDQLHPAQRAAARRGDAGPAAPDGAGRAGRAGLLTPGATRAAQNRWSSGPSASSRTARIRAARSAASSPVSRCPRRIVPGGGRPVCPGAPVQPRQQPVARQAAQLEQHERVGLDQPGQLVEHRQRVHARVDPGVAGAARGRARRRTAAARRRPPRRARPGRAAGRRPAARRPAPPPPRPSRPAPRRPSSSSTGTRAGDRPQAVARPRPRRRSRPASVVTCPTSPGARQRAAGAQVGLGVRRLLDRAHPRLAPPAAGPGGAAAGGRPAGGRRRSPPLSPRPARRARGAG